MLDDLPSILTVRQLSQILRVGINNAYALVRDGQIHSVRVGRQYRIPAQAVHEFLTDPTHTHE